MGVIELTMWQCELLNICIFDYSVTIFGFWSIFLVNIYIYDGTPSKARPQLIILTSTSRPLLVEAQLHLLENLGRITNHQLYGANGLLQQLHGFLVIFAINRLDGVRVCVCVKSMSNHGIHMQISILPLRSRTTADRRASVHHVCRPHRRE